MNFKEHKIHFLLEGPEIEEAVSAIFHTVLLHRTLPTLNFKTGNVSYNSYLGTRDVDCEYFKLTYVCVSSQELNKYVSSQVRTFAEALRSDHQSHPESRGTVTLEFATQRKPSWGIGGDPSPWEKWIISVEIKKQVSEADSSEHAARLGEQVRDEILHILDKMNAPNAYVPPMGSSRTEMDSVMLFTIPDICPYKFSISSTTTNSPAAGAGMGTAGLVGNAFRRILKDALI